MSRWEPRDSHATDKTPSTRWSNIVMNHPVRTNSIQYSIFGEISSYVGESRGMSRL